MFASQFELAAANSTFANSKATEETSFSNLVDEFFDAEFRADPDWATSLGIHQYDALSPDFSKTAIQEQIGSLKLFQKKFDEQLSAGLAARSKIDLDLIKSHRQSFSRRTMRSSRSFKNTVSSYKRNCCRDQVATMPSARIYLPRNFSTKKWRADLLINCFPLRRPS